MQRRCSAARLSLLLALSLVFHAVHVLAATLTDTCAKVCGQFEACIVYEGAEYCAQQCAPGRCDGATETCVLQGVECAIAPCLPVAVCEPKSEDLVVVTTPQGTSTDDDDTTTSSTCARVCPMIDAPVCVSDGSSYANACFFEQARCREPALAIVSTGLCDADRAFNLAFNSPSLASSSANSTDSTLSVSATAAAACDAIVCADVDDPVCSSRGTLRNACWLKRAQCRDPSVALLSRGPCSPPPPVPRCPASCTHEFVPVCGANGVLYANECLFRQAKCARPFAIGFVARDLAACELDIGDSTSSVHDVRAVLAASFS